MKLEENDEPLISGAKVTDVQAIDAQQVNPRSISVTTVMPSTDTGWAGPSDIG